MFSGLRSRLTYANVVSTLCLFMLLGGSAYASHLIVRSDDIVDNEVRSADVRDDTVTGGGLGGRDVRLNSLSGADISESTLGKVPDSDKLDGKDSSAFLQAADNFTKAFDLANIAAGECAFVSVSRGTTSGDKVQAGDIPMVFAPGSLDGRLVPHANPATSSGSFPMHLCNVGNVDINPPVATFQFVVLRP